MDGMLPRDLRVLLTWAGNRQSRKEVRVLGPSLATDGTRLWDRRTGETIARWPQENELVVWSDDVTWPSVTEAIGVMCDMLGVMILTEREYMVWLDDQTHDLRGMRDA